MRDSERLEGAIATTCRACGGTGKIVEVKSGVMRQVMLPGAMPTICRPCGGTGKILGVGGMQVTCFGCDGSGNAIVKNVRIDSGRYAKPWDEGAAAAIEAMEGVAAATEGSVAAQKIANKPQPSWRRKGKK